MGVKSLSLTVREEHRSTMLQNKVPRKLFKPKGDKVIRQCRKLCNEELHNLSFSLPIIRVSKSRGARWVKHVSCMEDEKFIQILVRKPVWKRPFGKPRCIWIDLKRKRL
jgi:hypothetical protein